MVVVPEVMARCLIAIQAGRMADCRLLGLNLEVR
jgi:hypothetical protein